VRSFIARTLFLSSIGLAAAGCGSSGGGGFIAAVVDATKSTVSANPTTGLVPNGTSASTVTVTILGAGGAPVQGATVTLAAAPSAGVTIAAASTSSATTDARGQMLFTVASTQPGPVLITASVSIGGSAPVPVLQTTTITFLPVASTQAGTSITVSPPSVVADGATIETLTVQARSAGGAVIPGATVTFTAPAAVTVGTPSATTDTNGIASTTLTSTRAGIQAIGIAIEDGTGAPTTTTSFNVIFANGPAAGLVFLTQPSQTTAGDAHGPFMSPPPQVAVVDATGNVVNGTGGGPTTSQPVWLQIQKNPAVNLLNGFSTVLCQSGVATFNYVSYPVAGTYSLLARATANGRSVAVSSNSFNVVPAAPAPAPGGLMFVNGLPNTDVNVVGGIPNAGTQSGWIPNTISGTAVVGSIALVDRFGNVVPGAGTQIVIAGLAASPAPTGTVTFNAGSPLTILTGANGVATFSATITDTVGPDTVSLAATQGAAGPTQRACKTTPFRITLGGGATAGSVLASLGPSNPNPVVSGTAVTSIQVAERDSSGGPVGGDNVTVSIVGGTAPVQTITGTAVTGTISAGTMTQTTAGSGIATFNDLVFDVSGTYTLQFASGTANVATATLAITVIGGAPAKLQFIDAGVAGPNVLNENAPDAGEPRNAAPGGNLGNVQVAVLDAHDNIATVGTGATPVSIEITGNPAGVTLNGSGVGANTINSVLGIATFSDLTVTGPNAASPSTPYTLTAVTNPPAAFTVQSAPFTVTNPLSVPGTTNDATAASRLVFTVQPPPFDVENTTFVTLAVEALDSGAVAAVVTGDSTDKVTLTLFDPFDPQNVTTVAAPANMVAGSALPVAGFIVRSSDLATGWFYIARSTHTNQAAVSDAFDFLPNVPFALGVVSQPTQTQTGTVIGSTAQFQAGVVVPATGVSPGPAVQVALKSVDGFLVSNESAPVTAILTSGNAVLGGTTTVNAVDGIATFSNLTLSATVLPQSCTITFVSAGLNTTTLNITVTN
jgi:adhesin/invasin